MPIQSNETRRALSCIAVIEDCCRALRYELYQERPFTDYLWEKVQPLLSDAHCIYNIIEREAQIAHSEAYEAAHDECYRPVFMDNNTYTGSSLGKGGEDNA